MISQKEDVIQVFDAIAARASWEKLYSEKPNRINYGFITRQRAVEEMIGPYAKGKVLDLGCGSGDLSVFYAKKGADYIGVDLSSKMIERANKNYANLVQQKKAVFQVGDCENLPFQDGEFDALSAVALIEYLPDPSKALDEMARITKKGGIVLLSAPHKNCVNNYIRSAMAPFRNFFFPLYMKLKKPDLAVMKDVKHFHYDREAMDRLMKKRGFERIDDRYTNFYVVPHPLDHLLPKMYMNLSERIDRGGRDKSYKNWAANYIALYKKN
jgi:ubiquinone/menaquinone biosynthesis C-methylase UbiE